MLYFLGDQNFYSLKKRNKRKNKIKRSSKKNVCENQMYIEVLRRKHQENESLQNVFELLIIAIYRQRWSMHVMN